MYHVRPLVRHFLYCAAVVLLFARHGSGALITNGSFEAPALAGSFETFVGGSDIGGWAVVGTHVNLIHSAYAEPFNGIASFAAQDGLNSIDLAGVGNTGLSNGVQQAVSTIAGEMYRLSFFVGRADGFEVYSTPSTLDLSIDGGPRVSYTNSDATPGILNWREFSTVFTATSASTTITFFNGTETPTQFGGPNNYVGLDDVMLERIGAVPEPSSLALIALGSLAICGAGCRRKRTIHCNA